MTFDFLGGNMAEEIKDPMEYIWERVPKTASGQIQYLAGDIPYLYRNGFVDTTRYTYQQWKAAFDDVLQDDGTYLVSKEKFMSLRVFRYEGPVFKPFEAARVREGEWSDEDLQKLFDRSIKPSSTVTQDIFWNSVKALKDQGFIQNGKLFVNQAVKNQLNYLIERFPSPRRRLEKEVNRIRADREAQINESKKNRDSSLFVVGKTSTENKMEDFRKLQTTTSVTAEDTAVDPDAPTLDLKSLRKPRGKISG